MAANGEIEFTCGVFERCEADRRIEALDRELNSLKQEMELRREVVKNTALVVVAREENRSVTGYFGGGAIVLMAR
ncbi:TPA: hypothetical protein ACH0S9_004774 [Citrobacter werkmanii]